MAEETEPLAEEEQPVLPEWPEALPSEPPEPSPAEIKRQESERAMQHRAELYLEMAKTDAFQMFLRELDAKGERVWADYYASLRPAPGVLAEPADQRKVDFNQGVGEGLGYPRRMIAAAESLLRKLDAEVEAEQESEPEDDTGSWD